MFCVETKAMLIQLYCHFELHSIILSCSFLFCLMIKKTMKPSEWFWGDLNNSDHHGQCTIILQKKFRLDENDKDFKSPSHLVKLGWYRAKTWITRTVNVFFAIESSWPHCTYPCNKPYNSLAQLLVRLWPKPFKAIHTYQCFTQWFEFLVRYSVWHAALNSQWTTYSAFLDIELKRWLCLFEGEAPGP